MSKKNEKTRVTFSTTCNLKNAVKEVGKLESRNMSQQIEYFCKIGLRHYETDDPELKKILEKV